MAIGDLNGIRTWVRGNLNHGFLSLAGRKHLSWLPSVHMPVEADDERPYTPNSMIAASFVMRESKARGPSSSVRPMCRAKEGVKLHM